MAIKVLITVRNEKTKDWQEWRRLLAIEHKTLSSQIVRMMEEDLQRKLAIEYLANKKSKTKVK
jgi:transcriptional regulator GlxA family with amidase domain